MARLADAQPNGIENSTRLAVSSASQAHQALSFDRVGIVRVTELVPLQIDHAC